MNNNVMNNIALGNSEGFGFNHDIVLKHSLVNAQLNGAISEVELVHEFVNRETCPIEAIFSFTLPLDAVILGLSMAIGERQFTGEVTPKAIGTDKYEGAIAEGDSAVLLERLNDGLYCLNVGNLLPNDDVTISIQYAQVLNWQDRKLRFYFPCTIGDRYGHQRSANLQDYQQIEHTLDNGARLTFNLTVNGELSSSLVTSPSHSLTVKREENSLILSGDRVIPDRDIIITLEALPSFTGEILVEKSAFGLQYCANLLLPSSDNHNESAQCFQFIVDRSGSMCGDAIEQVRKAFVAIKTLLKPSDWFNIISFGSQAQSLFPSPVPADSEHLAKLHAYINQLDANMGGTEIAAALNLARKTGRHAEFATQMLLITDGEVWDTAAIIADATKANIRLFSVGVGSAVNEAFLNKLSGSTGASAIYVSPNESMADAIVGQFKRCRQPEITDLKIHWPIPINEQVDKQLLFTGDGYQCYATSETEISPKTYVNIEIMKQNQSIPVRHFRGIGNATLSRLAAYQRLSSSKKPEEIAVKYSLLCEQTCCVLVAVRDQKADGLPELRTIRHTRAAGEAGFGSVGGGVVSLCFAAPVYSSSVLDCLDIPAFLRKQDVTFVDDIAEPVDSDMTAIANWLKIFNKAASNGSLELSFACIKSLGIDLQKILMIDMNFYPDIPEKLLVFEILLAFLEVSNAGRTGRKLRHWLQQQHVIDQVDPDIAIDLRANLALHLTGS